MQISNLTKVSLFIPNLHGGGAERVFINLAKILFRHGISVDLVVGNSVGELINDLEDLNMIDLESSSVHRSILPLARYLRTSKPDILISAMPHANLAALIASFISGKPCKVVSTVHENVFFALKYVSVYEKLILYILKFGYLFSDGFIAVSGGLLKSYEEFYGGSLPHLKTFIYNPIINDINPPDFMLSNSKHTDEIFQIISAGRLSIEKNFSLLINAFSLLENKSNIFLTIYGEGPERNALELLIKKLNLEQYVSLPGYTHNLDQKLRGSNLFVMTSIWEGFGNVLVEAMYAGCKIISTDCESGPREILRGGKYGDLVPVNDLMALAEAIRRQVNYIKPSYQSEEALAPFTFTNVGNQYLSFFKEVLRNK